MTEREAGYREQVADVLREMSDDELEGVAEDAPTYYPAPTGLTEEMLTIVYELAEKEIKMRKDNVCPCCT